LSGRHLISAARLSRSRRLSPVIPGTTYRSQHVQISEEYASDPAAADERYTGRRVNFGQVAVEGISYRAHPLRMLEDFFRVDDVKFRRATRAIWKT